MEKLFLIAFSSLIVFGCSNSKETIIGEWKVTSILLDREIDNNKDGVFSNNLLEELQCLRHVLIIKKDSTWTEEVYTLVLNGYENSDEWELGCDDNVKFNGKWILKNQKLYLYGIDSVFYTFNNSKLEFDMSYQKMPLGSPKLLKTVLE